MGEMNEFIGQLLKDAGSILMDYFGKAKTLGAKEHSRDIFTEADLAAQKSIVSAIQKKFPGHHIIAEEGGVKDNPTDHEWVWYVDPLDGTKNFATQTPLFGSIIGVAHNGILRHGGISIPVTNEIYLAEKGAGAFLNGSLIQCSEQKVFPTSLGLGGMGVGSRALDFIGAMVDNGGRGAWMHSIGSAAVAAAWTVAGRRDWYISQGGSEWDYAGGLVILEESGCVVTDVKGNPWKPGEKSLVAANSTLHGFIIDALNKSRKT